MQILCLPARDESDEIAGIMFAQVLQRSGFKAEAVSVTALASEMIELVEKQKADIVIVSALPPAAVTHARYLCKRLQQKFPDIHVIIGLWTVKGDLSRAKERMTCNDTDSVVNTFADAIHEVEQRVHPLLLTKATLASREEQLNQLEQAQLNAKPSKVGAAADARWQDDDKKAQGSVAATKPTNE